MGRARVELFGRLARDPEFFESRKGTPGVRLSIPVSKGKKDAQGNYDNSDTVWWSVVVWGELAEKVQGTLLKGDAVRVFVENPEPRTYRKKDHSLGIQMQGVAWNYGICPAINVPKRNGTTSAAPGEGDEFVPEVPEGYDDSFPFGDNMDPGYQ